MWFIENSKNVRGEGCALLSARELKAELEAANERIKQEYHKMNKIWAMLCLRKQNGIWKI